MTVATSAITTHVLDTAQGKPASGVSVQLEYGKSPDSFQVVGKGVTDSDGRVKTLLSENYKLEAGHYRLWFDLGAYYKGQGSAAFYDKVPVQFFITKVERHYHVPLLVSPFGYSTYRGS